MQSRNFHIKERFPLNLFEWALSIFSFLLLYILTGGQTTVGLTDADIKKSQRYHIEKGHQKFLSAGLSTHHYESWSPGSDTDTEENSGFEKSEVKEKESKISGRAIFCSAPFEYPLYHVAGDITAGIADSPFSVPHRAEMPLFILYHSWKSHLS